MFGLNDVQNESANVPNLWDSQGLGRSTAVEYTPLLVIIFFLLSSKTFLLIK